MSTRFCLRQVYSKRDLVKDHQKAFKSATFTFAILYHYKF